MSRSKNLVRMDYAGARKRLRKQISSLNNAISKVEDPLIEKRLQERRSKLMNQLEWYEVNFPKGSKKREEEKEEV